MFIVHSERNRKISEDINRRRFDELTEMINDTQRLFKNEVKEIFKGFKNVLKNETDSNDIR
jgi:hypothetical protein